MTRRTCAICEGVSPDLSLDDLVDQGWSRLVVGRGPAYYFCPHHPAGEIVDYFAAHPPIGKILRGEKP